MTRTKILRGSIIFLYLAMLLGVSVVYAAGSGELGFFGTAYVERYDPNNLFQFYPVPDQYGYYFTSANMPAGTAILGQEWVGNVFHLTIEKDAKLNGNIKFTMNFNFFNMTTAHWPAGTVTVDHEYSSGAANNAMFPAHYTPTLLAPAVDGLSPGNIEMDFAGKITPDIMDAIMFHAVYTYTDPVSGSVVTGKIYFQIEFRAPTDLPYTGWPPIV